MSGICMWMPVIMLRCYESGSLRLWRRYRGRRGRGGRCRSRRGKGRRQYTRRHVRFQGKAGVRVLRSRTVPTTSSSGHPIE